MTSANTASRMLIVVVLIDDISEPGIGNDVDTVVFTRPVIVVFFETNVKRK